MKRKSIILKIRVMLVAAVMACAIVSFAKKGQDRWDVHATDRPQPPIVTPGEQPGGPPSDAIVLFNGKDLSPWLDQKGNPAGWKVENGYAEVNGNGSIFTRQSFGDCQLHLEWATPLQVSDTGQHRGNSGIFFMSKYELQILDSYNNKTYPDGQAASLYGQYPPLVNTSRPPGQWQTYDIIFRRPHFDKDGKLVRPARITVLHNHVLVLDHVEFDGISVHGARAQYSPHPEKLPLMLQDHNHPVRFRNIWIRQLSEVG